MKPTLCDAWIIAQGDEILSGATLDSNSNWLAAELSARGVRVVGMSAAPDDAEAIAQQIRRACQSADLVLVSGGLGPTDDDLTAEAVALAAVQPLRLHSEALEQIAQRFRSFGRAMPDCNRKQAMLPRSAQLLENPVGTAPAFACDIGRARAFCFPGVPRELKALAEIYLWPWLHARDLLAPLRRAFHVCGIGESMLQERLRDLPLPASVRMGYKTWLPYNSIIVYGASHSPSTFNLAVTQVANLLSDDCFGHDEQRLPSVVGAMLQERSLTLAVAESCTAGGLGALVTEAAGSSAWFYGGVISYSNEVKHKQLDVPLAVLQEHGAVSEICAQAMAKGAQKRFGSKVALSVTGIAGPDGGSDEKPVGTVCFGMAFGDQVQARTVRFPNFGRESVRAMSAAHALDWLRRYLLELH